MTTEQRINSPFQLPRKWDNRKIAHSYDHPVFTVTHRALNGTLAAMLLTTHSSKCSSEESACHWEDDNCGSDVFNIQHTKLVSWSFILVNIFLFSYHPKAEDAVPQVLIPAGCGCLLLPSKQNQWWHAACISMRGTRAWHSPHPKEEGSTTWLSLLQHKAERAGNSWAG